MPGKPRIIAFYLPQYHPIKENDTWWGKGFTEWYNVGKAKPLFYGHKQPKVPTDLGYYDLRVPEVREEQAKLAQEAGIEGFCYWHYWFGNGRQLLELPLNQVIESGKPDFPFCIGWANEDWEAKVWGTKYKKNKLLIKQEYPGTEDIILHFNIFIRAFKDKRYILVDGKPVFFIYNPEKIPDSKFLIDTWNDLAVQNGLKGIYFIAKANGDILPETKKQKHFNSLLAKGYNSIYTNRVDSSFIYDHNNPLEYLKYFFYHIIHRPHKFNFKSRLKLLVNQNDKQINYFPGIICGWDHTPRSGNRGNVVTHFNSKNFASHIRSILDIIREKPMDKKIIFLKSWNEWGEGNYMEPDLHDGHMKIDTLKNTIAKYTNRKSLNNTGGSCGVKIVLVSLNGDDNSGGVERVVYYLNNILSEQYDVSILKRSVSFGGFDKIIYPFLFSLKLYFIKNVIVISNSWQSFLFPVDFSIHHGTTAGYMLNAGIKSKKSSILAWMEKISAQRAKRVLAVSKNCKYELENLFNIQSDKIIVLNNFVDEHFFYPEKAQIYKKSNVIRILFSGRLEERKGLSRLLTLAKALRHTSGYELHLAINSLENYKLFEGMENVYPHKNLTIPEMRLFYSSGDVLYFPSLYEGFSMATLEAMACGLPVIGTAYAIPEELRKYQFACLFEKDDALLLLNHIKTLYDKFHTQKNEIHSIITRDFGYEQYKIKLLSLIQEMAK